MTVFAIVLGMFGTVAYISYFIGVSEAAMTSSRFDDLPTETETRTSLDAEVLL